VLPAGITSSGYRGPASACTRCRSTRNTI